MIQYNSHMLFSNLIRTQLLETTNILIQSTISTILIYLPLSTDFRAKLEALNKANRISSRSTTYNFTKINWSF